MCRYMPWHKLFTIALLPQILRSRRWQTHIIQWLGAVSHADHLGSRELLTKIYYLTAITASLLFTGPTLSSVFSIDFKWVNCLHPQDNVQGKEDVIYFDILHIPQFFREFRWEGILYCRDIQKLYFGNPLYGRFCEKCKCKLRNVGYTSFKWLTRNVTLSSSTGPSPC